MEKGKVLKWDADALDRAVAPVATLRGGSAAEVAELGKEWSKVARSLPFSFEEPPLPEFRKGERCLSTAVRLFGWEDVTAALAKLDAVQLSAAMNVQEFSRLLARRGELVAEQRAAVRAVIDEGGQTIVRPDAETKAEMLDIIAALACFDVVSGSQAMNGYGFAVHTDRTRLMLDTIKDDRGRLALLVCYAVAVHARVNREAGRGGAGPMTTIVRDERQSLTDFAERIDRSIGSLRYCAIEFSAWSSSVVPDEPGPLIWPETTARR